MNPLLLLFGLLGAGASFGMRGDNNNGMNNGMNKGLGRDRHDDIAPTDGEGDTPGDFVAEDDTGSETGEPTGGVSTGGSGETGDTTAEDGNDPATNTGKDTPAPTGDNTGSGTTGGSGGNTGSTGGSTGGATTGSGDSGDMDHGGHDTGGSTGGATGGETTGTDGTDHGDHDMGGTGSGGSTDSTGGGTTGSGDSTGSTDGGSTGGTTTGSGDSGGTTGTGGTTGSTGGGTTGSTGGGTTGSTGGTTGSTGGSTGGHTGGSGHTMDHSTPSITPPGIGASQSAINNYLAALSAQPETHVHNASSSQAGEHDAAMNLVPRGQASHVAIGDGAWDDPATWSNGQVPGDDAKVLIPEGVTVDYSGIETARLFSVRIDGVLDFDTQSDSQMIFDTVVVSPSGHLIIGTDTDPVNPNVDIDLIVANNGPIDTNWDPMLLSRGIVSHGGTSIHGSVKDSHEKVTDDPMAGDSSVKFTDVPQGWEVGDTIVVAGTHYDGHTYDKAANGVIFHPSEDETRVITGIDSDGRIHLDQPLAFDHDAPRADLKTSVANYTRNVSVETENADSAAVFERGHVMFMHSDNVDVRYAEFHELGRTDKSFDSKNAADFGQTSFDSNVQGRYALHLHRTGITDPNDPAIVAGNAVYGSPGWGFVHHDSNAILDNNASFDTFGAGFVAETGNEIGSWNDNIAIHAQGNSWEYPKNGQNLANFDIARTGDGFWFQGRMVASTDNVAASVNHGFVYFHRDANGGMINFDADSFAFPEALFYNNNTDADQTPILSFDGNEAFAAKEGLHIVKHGPNQGHDVWSHLKDFTAWSVVSGAHMEYTSHYVLEDFDLVSRAHHPFIGTSYGIQFGNNASDMSLVNADIDGFRTGVDLKKVFIHPSGSQTAIPQDLHNFVLVDTNVTGANTAYQNYNPAIDTIISSNQLANLAPDLQLDNQLVLNNEPSSTSTAFSLTGTKTDSLGTTGFPSGTENITINGLENTDVHFDTAMRFLNAKGYWTTPGGQNYTLLDIYFTDRVTGDVYVETHPVYLNVNVGGVTHHGTQDITSSGGTQFAGNTPLDTAMLAVPVVTQNATTAAATHTTHAMVHTQAAMVPDTWLADQSGDSGDLDLTMAAAAPAPAVTTLNATVAEQPVMAAPETGMDMAETGGEGGTEAEDAEALSVEGDAIFTLMGPEETDAIFNTIEGGELTEEVMPVEAEAEGEAAMGADAESATGEEAEAGSEMVETAADETPEGAEASEDASDGAEAPEAEEDAEAASDALWDALTEDCGVVCDADEPMSEEGAEEAEDPDVLFAA